MKAILLAGGKGSRLRPYTTVLPKPLMPIGNMPILEVVIRQLAHVGIREIILAVGYLSELIEAYFGDGSRFEVSISYSREDKPLGTAGPIGLVPDMTEAFLVMNGDLLSTIDYQELIAAHKSRKAIATLAVYRREVAIDLGVISTDQLGWLTGYSEKPSFHFDVSTGIYVFEPSIIAHIPHAKRLDLPDLVLNLVEKGERVAVHSFSGEWLDIGRHDDYEMAIKNFQQDPTKYLPGYTALDLEPDEQTSA